MQHINKYISILCVLCPPLIVHAEQVQIVAINYLNQSSKTQLAINLKGDVHHKFFILSNPSRLVVDFYNMPLQPRINQPPVDHPLVLNVRSGLRENKELRLVFELKNDVDVISSLLKTLNSSLLQFELTKKPILAQKQVKSVKLNDARLIKPSNQSFETVKNVVNKPSNPEKGRDIIVAIDAGHGGKDVGAQGAMGTQEKDVVFAIAKRLKNQINRQPGMRSVMIRRGDYFVHLQDRVKLAHDAKADLFVSIHADAFNDSSAHGASVYTLSKNGASSLGARWLADTENAADAYEGKGNFEKDENLNNVLIDLTQTAAKEASQNIGNKVLHSVKSVGHLHRNAVQKAGFVVLKSPDIPSILIETAFISNPDEERRLTNASYQDKISNAVFAGIMSHFKQYAPANTLLALKSKMNKTYAMTPYLERASIETKDSQPANILTGKYEITKTQHTINQGETLIGIAQQYGVTTQAIKLTNNLENNALKVGKVLQIPGNG